MVGAIFPGTPYFLPSIVEHPLRELSTFPSPSCPEDFTLHLLFDARVLQPHFPGIGRYAAGLLQALVAEAPDLRLTLLTEAGARRLPLPGARWVEVAGIFDPRSQFQLPWRLRHSGAELFHAPYYLYPFALPLPTIVTIHDLIPLSHPGMIPAGWGQRLYRPLHVVAARRAAHVLTDSEGARQELLRFLPLSSQKVTVVHAAPDPFFSPARELPRERFFFSLLSNKPHKNGARLLRAYAATRPDHHHVPLYLAGPHDPNWPALEQLAAAAGVAEWVVWLGRISEERLRDCYRRCLAFLFPSFVEGFGLPALEAMACGAPTLVADASPMRDLVGDAALRFPPFDDGALARALRLLLEEPAQRAELAHRAVARAATFSWTNSARTLLSLYREVASR